MSSAPTITIFEGPDGAGKSTAVDAWMKRHRLQYLAYHHGPYLGESAIAMKYYDSMLPAYDGRKSVVMDRSWISEPIYAEAYRGGKSRVTVGQRRILERMALSRRGVIVLCRPKRETVVANWAAKHAEGNEYLKAEFAVIQVYELYKNLAYSTAYGGRMTALPVVTYDYQAGGVGGLFDRIEAARGGWSWSQDDVPGAGRWAVGTQVLLVGDRPNAADDLPKVPFGGLSQTGCSTWLAERLEDAGIPETALYWVNAFKASGKPEDAAFINKLEPRTVFALGVEASRWCQKNSIKSQLEVHPQFWKRFHHNKPYPLIDRIKEALS